MTQHTPFPGLLTLTALYRITILGSSTPVASTCLSAFDWLTCPCACRTIVPGSSAAGAFTSKYSIDGRDVSLQQYNDRLKTFGILVKAKNFLVFQVGLQGRCCCSQPAGHRAALRTLSCWAAALRYDMHARREEQLLFCH